MVTLRSSASERDLPETWKHGAGRTLVCCRGPAGSVALRQLGRRRAVPVALRRGPPGENFTDFGHFPWVHPGLLGDPQRPVVPRHEVHTDGHVLRYEIVRPEAPNSEGFPVFAAELHLRFDAVAVAYRKAMRDLGLAATAPIGISAE